MEERLTKKQELKVVLIVISIALTIIWITMSVFGG